MKEEPKSNNMDMWLSLMTGLFTTQSDNTRLSALEKEVAYLHGKIDVLEKVILKGDDNDGTESILQST